jgi:hypothetical protein
MLSLALRREAERRSISAENPSGERGGGARATEGTGAAAARDLGRGWKVSPSRVVRAGEELEIAAIDGPAVIDHFWITTRIGALRSLILRARWEGAEDPPAIEVPLGDFFCQGWGTFAAVNSALIVAAPHGGLNSYFPMPFRRSARLAVENVSSEDAVVYYQVDYSLRQVPEAAGYLHAHWRRSNPVVRGEVHELLGDATGAGAYLGTYLAVGVNGPGWWGEGEMKFYLDDDGEFPTICGTGTEDYFGGAYDFDVPGRGYTTFSSPYLGMHQFVASDNLYRSQMRFGMYRWHVPDPIDFSDRCRVTIQDLGWRSDGRYLLRGDDIASVCYWYSDDPAGVRCHLAPDELDFESRPR